MLTEQMRTEQGLMVKLAASQMELRPVLQRLADGGADRDGGIDDATRGHIRNLDVYVTRLLEETVNGRNQLASELRSEIKLLARTIAAAAGSVAAQPAAAPTPTPAPAEPTRTEVTPPVQPAGTPPQTAQSVRPRVTVRPVSPVIGGPRGEGGS